MTSSPRFKACLFASVVSLLISSDCAAEKPIFKTSFEDMKSGQFDNAEINELKFTTSGTCNITNKYAGTGKQCLHLLGDEGNVITFNLPTAIQNVHRSQDDGKTWNTKTDYSLCDPRCNASIIRYPVGLYGNNSELLLFCNAAPNSERMNLAVRLSKDNGDTWNDGRVIDSGRSAYSKLDILSDSKVIVVYEPGHSEIRAVTFELDELLTPTK